MRSKVHHQEHKVHQGILCALCALCSWFGTSAAQEADFKERTTWNAQNLRYGVKAGVNFSSIAYESLPQYTQTGMRTGLGWGVYIARQFHAHLGLRAELLYLQRGHTVTYLDYDNLEYKGLLDLDYLAVPVLLTWNLGGSPNRTPFLELGPELDMKLSAKWKGMDQMDQPEYFGVKSVISGLNLGAGVNVSNLSFDVRGYLDLTKFLDRNYDAENQSLQIMLGYTLGGSGAAIRARNIVKPKRGMPSGDQRPNLNSGQEGKPSRGLPPDLYADLDFRDANGDGILDAQEAATLILTLSNRGKGPANRLEISTIDDLSDPALLINKATLQKINPDDSSTVTLSISAGIKLKSAVHRLQIKVTEYFGYDMDPAYLVLTTQAFQPPNLTFSGLEVVDWGEGTFGKPEDGQLQAGEQVKIRVVVQNLTRRPVEQAKYAVVSANPDIYISDGTGSLGNIVSGDTKEFWLTVSPNKRIETSGKLPIFLTIKEATGEGGLRDFNLPLELNQKPQAPQVVEVKPDLAQQARFEFTSSKFTAKVRETEDIRTVIPAKTKRPNSVAVVIGVENYQYLPRAPYAANDANLMSEYFKKRLGVEDVVLYKEGEVSGVFFDRVFNPDYGELRRAVVIGQTELFVYYSGHGLPAKDGSAVYLFPADGLKEQFDKVGYNLATFYENLNKLGAKSVMVILDACFSGGSRATGSVREENLVAHKAVGLRITKPWLLYPNFTVVNSSAADETSLGYDPSQTGLFTYWLALGLQGKADANGDRKVTLKELKDYVTANVSETSRKISGPQSPEFYGANDDWVLVEY